MTWELSMDAKNQLEDSTKSPVPVAEESPGASEELVRPEAPPKSEQQDAFDGQQAAADLVSKAQLFLESPELNETDGKHKAQYLAEKGLPVETIDELQRAIASIPIIPPRTYPEALVSPVRSRFLENLVTLYYFFTYAAGASAFLTWVYSKFIFPRWIKMILAKRRLREHQAGLMQRLNDSLKAHKENSLTPPSISPSVDSKPAMVSQLQGIHAHLPNEPQKTTRQHTLQSLSDLTGYLSSQLHLSSALDAASRTYQFQFSMPGAAPGLPKSDVQEQLKKDIRALKGLLINRRTFLQNPTPSRSGTPAQ